MGVQCKVEINEIRAPARMLPTPFMAGDMPAAEKLPIMTGRDTIWHGSQAHRIKHYVECWDKKRKT
jgi:hypothetical protein